MEDIYQHDDGGFSGPTELIESTHYHAIDLFDNPVGTVSLDK